MRGSTAGFSDSVLKTPTTVYNKCLEYLDCLFSALIVAPLVVGYWRGTWNFSFVYIFPDNSLYSGLCSTIMGIGGHLICTFIQNPLRRKFHPSKHRISYYFVSRIYTYVYGFVCVNHWRGMFVLIALYSPHSISHIVWVTLVSVLLLSVLKGIRNIAGAPFTLNVDQPVGYFTVRTMYQTSGTREPGLYVLDCMFSVLIVGSLVVFVWRGVWVFLDLALFPDDKQFSAVGSLAIGYGIVAITFASQPIMRWTCERLTGLWRLATADLFLIFSFLGTVNVWRGVWMILDLYFIPENPLLSDWITHGVSLLLLALLNCSNSVLVRGVYIDAEEPAGQCVVFPVYYIRLFFQKERSKKQQRMTTTLASDKKDAHLSQQLIPTAEQTPVHIIQMNRINSNHITEQSTAENEREQVGAPEP